LTEGVIMALKKLLNKGTVYKRNDGYWGGAVRYLDETGKVCRKGFSGVTKKAILKKISDYIIVFKKEIAEADFYSIDDLPVLPNHGSIARRIIEEYIAEMKNN
jgi:hypothetical protein